MSVESDHYATKNTNNFLNITVGTLVRKLSALVTSSQKPSL